MLLSITSTRRPATDLGYLLHKNPARSQSFELAFGQAHVVYPEAEDERCTAVLLLDIDPVGLVRNRRGPSGEGFALEQYVNDRPYVASSFLSVAIAQVYGTALAGRCAQRPELAETALPLEAHLTSVPCRGGEALLRRLFEPLGYAVTVERSLLDEQFPEWGQSPYLSIRLAATCRLSELLSHLYVLIPVLDNDKHYWIGEAEVDKLLRHGAGWLATHPEREAITRRYLRRSGRLIQRALERLLAEEEPEADESRQAGLAAEEQAESAFNLNQQRLETVCQVLQACGARRVLDLGCSSGNLLRRLLQEAQFETLVGFDVSHRSLEIAAERLRLEQLPPRQRARIELLHGSLNYRDRRLDGFDAAAVVEVIEHLDPPRLAAFERVLFELARPGTVVVTTPNVEYNPLFPTLPAGRFRHADHRFEWTRQEFRAWSARIAERFGYHVRQEPIGPLDPERGAPTQMAVFSLHGEAA